MRILIVEDEPRIRDFLTRAFEAEGFTVTAVDGRQLRACARASAASTTWWCSICCCRGCNGLEVLREIRYHQPDLPVLILSRAGPTWRRGCAASSSAPSTTWPSRSRSTSCSRGRASTCAGRAAPTIAR